MRRDLATVHILPDRQARKQLELTKEYTQECFRRMVDEGLLRKVLAFGMQRMHRDECELHSKENSLCEPRQLYVL